MCSAYCIPHALTTCLLCTGEIDYNELASLIMTGDILGRSSWLRERPLGSGLLAALQLGSPGFLGRIRLV